MFELELGRWGEYFELELCHWGEYGTHILELDYWREYLYIHDHC